MFKKAINSVLVVLLLFTTTGFSVTRHYCGEHLVSIALGKDAKACCDNTTGTCCHQETRHFQLKGNFLSGITQISQDVAFSIDLFNLQNLLLPTRCESEFLSEYEVFSDSSPPLKQSLQSFLQTYLL